MKKLIYSIIIAILLLSTIAAAGFWGDITGDVISAFKKTSLVRQDTSSRIIPPVNEKAIDFLNNYPSLANVKTKINSMAGLDALEEAFSSYNPYEAISVKERKFNEIFSSYSSLDEEERIYIIHLAHALWIEKNHAVPWSLRDYNADEITALLERGEAIEELAHRTFERTRISETHACHIGYSVDDRDSCSIEYQNISQGDFKLFPLTKRIVNNSRNQLEAASNLVEWAEQNFFHATEEYGWERYGGDVRTVKEFVSYEDLFRERIIGCHDGADIFAGFLRSINIPAYEVHTRAEGHGITYMPSLGLFAHGDLLANLAAVPASLILMPLPQMEEQIAISPGFTAYSSYIRTTAYPYYSITLEREGNYLYIGHLGVLSAYPSHWAEIRTRLKEYNISIGGDTAPSSARVKIKTLREITNPPLEIARGIPTIREKIPIITSLTRMFGR
ncbi:MAG TPA: hypothetical protein HA362_03600 [Nanoarchaeota archaeon]|nr:hypothetical protein [Nanoarchaeota archaeon]